MGWRFTVATLLAVLALSGDVLCKPSLLAGFKPRTSGDDHHHHHDDHSANKAEVASAEDLDLNTDGSYSYKYRLTDGSFQYAKANALGEIQGGYGYKNTEGQDVVIEFTANKDTGFQPRGSHLNEIPALPGVTQEEARAADVDYDENADRSYKFGYNEDDSSRTEEADSTGRVVGSYKFIDNDGIERSVRYEAGAGIGFKPMADFIPGAGNQLSARSITQVQSNNVPALSILPPSKEAQAEFKGYPAPVQNPQKFYSRPVKTPETLYSAPEIESDSSAASTVVEVPEDVDSPVMVMDASYSFGYDNDVAARQESADQTGNINGQYTYVNPEGNQIVVKYSAGANKGFVIENESELSEAVDKATIEAESNTDKKSVSLGSRNKAAGTIDNADITFVGPNIDDSTWIQDKTYTFGFRGAESSRSEMSDENGNVRGTYTIPDTEGKPILVRYKAGPKVGFVIENLEEVQRRTGQLSGSSASSTSDDAIVITAAKPKVVVKAAPKPELPSRPQQNGFLIAQQRSQQMERRQQQQQQQATTTNVDRSYNFQYGLSDNKRQEVADESGNIRGHYEYVTAEGNRIRVTYSAGPGKGFVIENEEDLSKQLTKATFDGAAAIDKIRSESDSSNVRKIVRKGGKRTNGNNLETDSSSLSQTYLPPSDAPQEIVTSSSTSLSSAVTITNDDIDEPEPQPKMDASFSFSVSSDDGTHEESSDTTGERFGSYSYTSPEGQNVVVRYRAGRDGFVILNPEEVLPKAV